MPASLEMARWTLELLHEPPALVDQMVTRFVRHDAEVLARETAVSEAVANQMAAGDSPVE